jgi:hypothetical protein
MNGGGKPVSLNKTIALELPVMVGAPKIHENFYLRQV